MAEKKYNYAIGRRKTSTARVRLFDEAGDSLVNDKKLKEVYKTAFYVNNIQRPFVAANLDPKAFSFTAKVSGGGFVSQSEAICLAIARAIVKHSPDLKKSLKVAGLLTRDSRMVERKKTGKHKARKSEQYSKR